MLDIEILMLKIRGESLTTFLVIIQLSHQVDPFFFAVSLDIPL
jgi:hypothetical protein